MRSSADCRYCAGILLYSAHIGTISLYDSIRIAFNACRRGKKTLDYARDKDEGTHRSGVGGEGPAM